MFTTIEKIRNHRNLTRKLKRERKLIAEATERVVEYQRVRYEVMRELSAAGMLKDNVS